jgi:hypothetical protein
LLVRRNDAAEDLVATQKVGKGYEVVGGSFGEADILSDASWYDDSRVIIQ